jgi:hypothetical protein
MSDEGEKVFLEFTLEGVLRVTLEEKESAIKELTRILSRAMKSRDLIRLNSNISAISERDIMFAMYSGEPYEDN